MKKAPGEDVVSEKNMKLGRFYLAISLILIASWIFEGCRTPMAPIQPQLPDLTATFTPALTATVTATSTTTSLLPTRTSTPTVTSTFTSLPLTPTHSFTVTSTPTSALSSPTPSSTLTATVNNTPTGTATATATLQVTPTTTLAPFASPTIAVPPTGIYIAANLTDMQPDSNFNMVLSVNGAAENAPVSFGPVGSMVSLTGTSSYNTTGGAVEGYFYGSAPYSPGSYYVIEAFTTIGTASVTLLAPGRPVYTGSNTFTWSPEGNADFASSSENKVGGIYYQTENYTGDIDSPFTFPVSALSDPGNNYTLSMYARAASFNISNANSQSYFLIYSDTVVTVGE